MDRRQQLFKRGEGGNGPGALLLGGGIDDSDGRVVDGFDCGDLKRRFDSRFALGRQHLARQFRDGLFEVGIVSGKCECRLVLHQRFFERTPPAQCVGESADGREVLWRRPQGLLEFVLGVFVVAELDERSSERDARRVIRRVHEETGAAHVHRFVEHARPAVLFRELGKRNRRRVLLDPSSEIFKT
jgi:hypothetical protein